MDHSRAAATESTALTSGWARAARAVVSLRSDLTIILLDAALVAAAYTAMLVLRYDGEVPDHAWRPFLEFLPLAVGLTIVINLMSGLYGRLWRHASLFEAQRMAMAGAATTVILTTIVLGDRMAPLATVVGGGIVATFLMGLLRFQSRLFSFRRNNTPLAGMGVVVIGARDAGASLVGEMARSPRMGFRPVAVLDDEPIHHGRSFMGVEVWGGIDDLPRVVEATGANLAVLAHTSPPQELVRRAAEAAERADIALKILPGMGSTMRTGSALQDIRDVRIEDLLGRDEIHTDLDAVMAMLRGRRVLVTGAGGSIGSEISRQVAACSPELLVLVDHDETHLHDVATELPEAEQVLVDIRNRDRLVGVFEAFQPEVVFHAAAHKHVPILERFACEAAETNVIGTANVLDASLLVGVARFVAISTDKAVYPSSVMGASKRISEQLVLGRAPQWGSYCAVRFGNVLGSRGSVVPTFMKQIQAGGPVTVTDKRMTRYFMSIEEAVQLVLQASALTEPDQGGEIFMLDMGEPVRIVDLAERMIRLSGRRPGTDIKIEITGTRPGEKLSEELRTRDETEHDTGHPSVRRVCTGSIDDTILSEGVWRLQRLANVQDHDGCRELIQSLARDGRLDDAATTARPIPLRRTPETNEPVEVGA